MIWLKFLIITFTGIMVALLVHELVGAEPDPVSAGSYAGSAVVNLLFLFVLLKDD